MEEEEDEEDMIDEEPLDLNLKDLKGSTKTIEMNIALSGLEGKDIQDLANEIIQQRHLILD